MFRKYTAIAVVMLAGLFAFACGGDDSKSKSEPTTTAKSSANDLSTAAVAAKIKNLGGGEATCTPATVEKVDGKQFQCRVTFQGQSQPQTITVKVALKGDPTSGCAAGRPAVVWEAPADASGLTGKGCFVLDAL
jgi:hypothetical protein